MCWMSTCVLVASGMLLVLWEGPQCRQGLTPRLAVVPEAQLGWAWAWPACRERPLSRFKRFIVETIALG